MRVSESFLNGRVTLHAGDSRDVLKTIPDCSIDSIVTDPPYALVSIVKRFGKSDSAPAKGNEAYQRASAGFMGKQWDTGETAFATEFWAECLRVLKPGGHVVAFSGTRTYHRMACAIEDAGFEIRDQLQWLYGSGFPKSHNAGDGWGTALKPACEPVCFGRKSLIGTVAANVLEHGTGAINIDGCRIETDPTVDDPRLGGNGDWSGEKLGYHGSDNISRHPSSKLGRWPANIIHDGSEEVIAAFPETTSGVLKAGTIRNSENKIYGKGMAAAGIAATDYDTGGDSGSAARFFYTAKADADDRLGSKHPTVKPVDLMQWLCRLVTPKGGTVLDPFAGTGTTGEAAFREGFNAVLIEREEEYQADIRRRMALCMAGPDERKRESIKAKLGDVPFEPGSLFA
jgi:site-specific DNA-methyltransferase (adenine-specific)